VAGYDDINQSVQVVEEAMQANPDLDGWFFVGLWPLFAERGSMPLWEAASESGELKNVVFDTLPIELDYMKEGLVHGLVGQKYWGWGYDTVQMIYDKMVEGAEYDDWTDSGMDIVTMANVDAMAEAWATSDFTQPLPDPFAEVAEAPMEAEGELLVISAPCENNKIKEIAALDDMTVQFTTCKPDPAFLAKVAFTPFYIQPREWIEETGGTGELLEHPIGTGPYYIDSWNRGDSIVFKRFDDYWGDPAETETLVFRWATEGAARLLELQAGTVDHITKVSPDDYEVVQGDPNLQFLPAPNPNILYLAMTNTFEPWGDPNVRKAIAMGIDRQRIVDNFFPAGSEVASHFTPCSIPNACQGEEWYEFDPEAARALLAEAGYPDGFETAIYYRDVFRVYLPEPGVVAQDIQAQLKENLNIDADVVVMESGEFIDESQFGRLDGLYLLGWGADYLHVTNFLDYHFGRSNLQFGDPHPEIYEVLEEASTIADEATVAPLYEEANNQIKELVPMVPVAHGAPAHAALADVEGAHTAVLGPPSLWKVNPGGRDTLVYLKAAEPISLYCMDEADGESLDACKMVTEGLYKYDEFGVAQPTLATECTANEDATVWTCTLREGVTFQDGSTVDANDVVRSWDAGVNAASPYHTGNTGAFTYPSYLFDALMNLEE
jgi:ABC-type transport system substrate-binding protein